MNVEQAKKLNIPVVGDRHYWFVRTTGGAHYEDFVANGYIAIGWDYLSVKWFRENTEDTIKRKIEQCERATETSGSENGVERSRSLKQAVTMIYNKTDRFINAFQEGDVVVVPSKNSERLAIGIIASAPYEDSLYSEKFFDDNPNSEIVPCPYTKRRKVNWVKGIAKAAVDPFLSKALNAQHSISNIDTCANLINRSIYNFYATESDIHAIIHAGHPNGVSLEELKQLIETLDAGFKMGADIAGEPYDPKKIDVKIAIHSPGIVEIYGAMAVFGLSISVLLSALAYYRHGGKEKGKFALKLPGFEFSGEFEHESKGTLDYELENKKLDAKILDELLVLEEKLAITYPEVMPLKEPDEKAEGSADT